MFFILTVAQPRRPSVWRSGGAVSASAASSRPRSRDPYRANMVNAVNISHPCPAPLSACTLAGLFCNASASPVRTASRFLGGAISCLVACTCCTSGSRLGPLQRTVYTWLITIGYRSTADFSSIICLAPDDAVVTFVALMGISHHRLTWPMMTAITLLQLHLAFTFFDADAGNGEYFLQLIFAGES